MMLSSLLLLACAVLCLGVALGLGVGWSLKGREQQDEAPRPGLPIVAATRTIPPWEGHVTSAKLSERMEIPDRPVSEPQEEPPDSVPPEPDEAVTDSASPDPEADDAGGDEPLSSDNRESRESSIDVTSLQGLQEVETRYSDIFDDAPFLYQTVDPYGYIVTCNRTEAERLGYEVGELVGRSVFDLVHPGSEKAMRGHLRDVRTCRDGLQAELRLLHSDGHPFDALVHSRPVYSSAGKFVGVRSLLQDMTMKRERELLLEKASHALAEKNAILAVKTQEILRVNRSRSEFISSVSHELRTPLHAVIGYAELLGRGLYGSLRDRQQKAVDGIVNRGNDLLNLINNILDLSRIEAGRLQLEHTRFSPAETLEEVIQTAELMQAKAEEADDREFSDGIEEEPATVEIRSFFQDAPQEVIGDHGRYKQVVLNLVSNAIRYTERGHVDVICRREADGAFVTAVSDTGIGIAPEDQDAIFEAFYQVEASSTRFHGGTGLGLSIVRRLVEQMGGRITLLSRLGVGSTFYVHLPEVGPEPAAEDDQEAEAAAETGLRLPPRRAPTVLVCGLEGQGYLGVLAGLRNDGLDLLESSTSAEGIDLARRRLPTAIVHLLGDSRTNPADLVTLVRGDPVTAHIPIVLVGPARLKSALHELPVDGYVTVPTDGAEVADTVWPLIGQRRRRILLIGPREEAVDAIALTVRRRGFAVARARRGARAVSFLNRNEVPMVVACNDMPDITLKDLLDAIDSLEEEEHPRLVVILREEVSAKERVELGERVLSILDPSEHGPDEIGARILELLSPLQDAEATLTDTVEVRAPV